MIPQFHYTKEPSEAWYPLTDVAEGVAQFFNWYWQENGEGRNFYADTVMIENGKQALIRVTFENDFVTYVKHPISGL